MKAFSRPDFPAFPRNLVVLALCGVVVACGSSGGGETAAGDAPVVPIVTEVITGHVIDGYIEGARVCIDLNANASCDGGEAQAFTDAQGAYRLEIPKDSTAPLLADVIAGRSRDLDTPQTSVDRSFRMSSPSRSYSTTITPFTTLVHLAGDRDYALAEDIVRNEVGLPPRYAIGGDYVAAGDRYAQNVAKGDRRRAQGDGGFRRHVGRRARGRGRGIAVRDHDAAAASHRDQERGTDPRPRELRRCDLRADQSGLAHADRHAQRQDPRARPQHLGHAEEPVQGAVQQRRGVRGDDGLPRHEEAAQLGAARRLLRPLADPQQARLLARQQQRVP